MLPSYLLNMRNVNFLYEKNKDRFKPDFTDFIWAKPRFFSVPVTALDVYKENNGHRKRYKTIGTVLNRINVSL